MPMETAPTISEKEQEIKKEIGELGLEKEKELLEEIKSANYFSNIEDLKKYFDNAKKLDKLAFTVDSEVRNIPIVRNLGFEYLSKRGLIKKKQEYLIKNIIGEIVRDTLHSKEQNIKDSKFTIILRNLNNPDHFYIEIINPDKIQVRDWPTKTYRQAKENIRLDSSAGFFTGIGTQEIDDIIEDINQNKKNKRKVKLTYYDLKENGEKEFTLSQLEIMKKEQNE